MNVPLFKATLKANWIFVLIITAAMFMYLSLIANMFDPENLSALQGSIDAVPPALAAALQMDTIPTKMTDFLARYFYGFLIQIFTIVYCVLLANRLVVKHVDSGAMSCLLSTPNSRANVVTTQAIFMFTATIAMYIIVTLLTIVVAASSKPGELNVGAFVVLNMCSCLLTCAMASICFLFSCLFNESKYALAAGSGVLVFFFICSLIGNMGHHMGGYAAIEKLSLYTLFDARRIAAGDANLVALMFVFALISALFSFAGIIVFKKRNLPL
jgi:ABC-2 type transport system permease protein